MMLTDCKKAVIIINRTTGIGVAKAKKVFQALNGKPEAILDDVSACRQRLLGVLSERDYGELCVSLQTGTEEIERTLTRKNIEVVTCLDDEYPKQLRMYDNSPVLLYCKGDVKLMQSDCFAVVGTRYPTKYGVRVTEDFVGNLSSRFCIVSGMARGVDSVAHRACLDNMGKTIAVLGCGVDVVYPPENKGLYDEIVERGLVISEYAPGEIANAHNFPARNRIISGLSRGVLVTEAGEKSGTILTINYALEQGKDVFCVPGSIYNKASAGCNLYIKDCQSRAVTDVNDIYDEIGLTKVDLSKPSAIQLDVNESAILDELNKNGEMHFEELLQIVDLTVPQLNSLLIKMESVGLITKTKHNYWSV